MLTFHGLRALARDCKLLGSLYDEDKLEQAYHRSGRTDPGGSSPAAPLLRVRAVC